MRTHIIHNRTHIIHNSSTTIHNRTHNIIHNRTHNCTHNIRTNASTISTTAPPFAQAAELEALERDWQLVTESNAGLKSMVAAQLALAAQLDEMPAC